MIKKLSGLVASQFLGVFCEYACKIMVFTIATRPLWSYNSPQLIATLSLLSFLIPKLLFSFPAGIIADRFSKRTVLIITKGIEAFVLLMGALCLFIAPEQIIVSFALLALLGMQSALFNPAKSGIVPELIPVDQIGKGNGLIEMWGMAAIFLGTAVGPFFLMADQGGMLPHLTWTGPLCLAIVSLLGLLSTLLVPHVEKAMTEERRPLEMLIAGWKTILRHRALGLIVAGTAIYWIFMSFIGQTVLVHAKETVIDEVLQGLPLGCYWLGIAIGALYGGRSKAGLKLIPSSMLLFACVSTSLVLISPGLPGMLALLILMGFAAGVMLVPLQTFVQVEAPKEQRGSVIASSNILNIKGILLGSYLSFLFC
jgi:acyl-[acyl-carrier-protein]-phospholipid O-acyltransferase/long-chain-fatty-acid--[acyl-carrier-protein] ligase